MPLKKKAKKKEKHSKVFNSIHEIAVFLEETRLADYIDLMQKPHRMAWMNFWGGVWRGLGMVVGTVVVFALLVLFLKNALHHAGGLPWIGAQVEEMIAWLLSVIEKQKG